MCTHIYTNSYATLYIRTNDAVIVKGHSLGAAGGFEAVACVKTLETGIIAPTINYKTPDPDCDLDYCVNKAVSMPDIQVAMSDNLGFGGHNGAVVFRKL